MEQSKTARYCVWLVNTLMGKGRLTFLEISNKWVDDMVNDGRPLARSAFNRYRDAILDKLGVVIECRQSDYTYFIANPSVLEDGSVERWQFSAMTVSATLGDSVAARDRILLENVPSGERFLVPLVKATRENRRIRMGYQKFGFEGYVKEVNPYAMKIHENRWYILADNGERLAVYALDRMFSVELTDEHYELPDGFSAEAYFSDYFGVLTDATPLAHIRLRAYGRTPDYLRTLPLHHSQRELSSGDGYTDFSLDIRPTADFVNELFRFNAFIEVLEPESLRVKMCSIIGEMLNKYKNG